MKLRSGFVSNSSSTSFAIKREEEHYGCLTTTACVAIKMLAIIYEDNEDWAYEDEVVQVEQADELQAIRTLERHIRYDGPILIPWSINYNTEIYAHPECPDAIVINTCTNHYWDLPWDRVAHYDDEDDEPISKGEFLNISIIAHLEALSGGKQLEFRTMGDPW
jgi:hypothetical protein